MRVFYDTLNSALTELAESHNPDEWVTVRGRFECGLLAWAGFLDLIAAARASGLDIEMHRGGGMLVRRGYLVVQGSWGQVRAFLTDWQRMMNAS